MHQTEVFLAISTSSQERLIKSVSRTISDMTFRLILVKSIFRKHRKKSDTAQRRVQAQTRPSRTKSPSKSDGNPFLTANEKSKGLRAAVRMISDTNDSTQVGTLILHTRLPVNTLASWPMTAAPSFQVHNQSH